MPVDIIGRYFSSLLEHGANPLPNFHVVDTRGTLQRSALGTTGNDGDWLNEIHPNRGGYDKLAGLFSAAVRTQLGM